MPFRSPLVRLALLVAVSLPGALAAQEPIPAAPDTTQNAALRVYLDCDVHGCDDDHMKTEMTWVNWMRERQDADFHILVTSETTGGGGRRYVVVAIGQRAYAGRTDTLEFTSKPDEVVDALRTSLLRLIGQLLMPHAAKGPLGSQLSVTFTPAGGGAASGAPAKDKWNFWNFTISGNAFVSGESQQSFIDAFTEVGANRTTERWKIRANFYQQLSRQRFVYQVDTGTPPATDTVTIVDIGRQRSAFGSAYVAQSLGEHWSFGARTIVGTSRFNNLELASQLTAAAEWNLYPFKDYTRRSLTVLYTVGIRALDYQDSTIYGKLAETRPIQTLHAAIGAKQKWGEVDVTLSGSQYLDALKYYSLGLNGNISVNIVRGLSFETGGSFSRVRNQLYLSKVGLTPQDVLLRQRARATDYRYFSFFGLQYRFGSIFNSVVNSRFGRINQTDDF